MLKTIALQTESGESLVKYYRGIACSRAGKRCCERRALRGLCAAYHSGIDG